YSRALARRDEIIVGNKIDLTGADEALVELEAALGTSVLPFSGATGDNERTLLERMWTAVQAARQREADAGPARIDFGEPEPLDEDAQAPEDAEAAAARAAVRAEDEDFGDLDLRSPD